MVRLTLLFPKNVPGVWGLAPGNRFVWGLAQ